MISEPSLVVLAAGLGTRFGGLKQLVAVRNDGATITDVLIGRAADAGLAQAVIVVGAEIEELMRAHLDGMGTTELPVELVVQSQPRGTADAVLAARKVVRGPCVVVNADDLYPAGAFSLAVQHLRAAPVAEHAAVGFRVDRTLVGPRPEARARLIADAERALVTVCEGSVEKGAGLQFRTATSVANWNGDEIVSMNMWVLRASAFDALAAAVDQSGARDPGAEVFLPDVVATMIAGGAIVRVLPCAEECIGITYPEDVDAVRAILR